jgi:hypothetical protein
MQNIKLDTTYKQFAEVDGRKLRIAPAADGTVYAQIAETLPDGQDAKSREQRERIEAADPLHFASSVAGYTGYWIPLDKARGSKPAESTPVESKPQPAEKA